MAENEKQPDPELGERTGKIRQTPDPARRNCRQPGRRSGDQPAVMDKFKSSGSPANHHPRSDGQTTLACSDTGKGQEPPPVRAGGTAEAGTTKPAAARQAHRQQPQGPTPPNRPQRFLPRWQRIQAYRQTGEPKTV